MPEPEQQNTNADRYIWHETIQTQQTRRSFLSEIAPDVLPLVQEWLKSDRIEFMPGYECVITYRSARGCLQAEIYNAAGVRLEQIGIASNPRCGQPMWSRLSGKSEGQPAEPWCAVSLDRDGLAADPLIYYYLGDFERCLAWAWLLSYDSP